MVYMVLNKIFLEVYWYFVSRFGSSHEEINDDWGDPFAEMRRRIQLHMARMQEVANHFFNKWHTVNEGSVHVSVQRPQGHMVNAFIGWNSFLFNLNNFK